MKTTMTNFLSVVFMHKMRSQFRLHRFGWQVLFGLMFALGAQAQSVRDSVQVWLPNGYITVRQEDMMVQTTAGPVRWARTWDGQEWTFNSQWESLSQSWKNLTGSQSADTTSGGSAGGISASSGSGGTDSGCWVLVDEDWQPSTGSAVIDGVPDAGPMLAARTTPFNRVMGEASADYPPAVRVNVDYATLCAGNSRGGGSVQETEGLRRINELYLGDEGRYSFNNRTILEKRAVQQLPPVSNTAAYANLSTGKASLASQTNAKGFRWQDRNGDWVEYNTQGQMVARGDRNNNTIWLVRDTDGMLRSVVDSNGRVLFTLHYTGALLTEVRDYPIAGLTQDLPARSVKYAYDDRNRLTQVTDVRGYVTKYEYDVGNHITKITDQEAHETKLAYNHGIVKQRIAADGGVTDYVFDYDDVNKQFISKITGPVTAAGRRVEDYTHNRVSKLVRRIVNGRIEEEVKYDTGARVTTSTNARGFATKTTRNEFDQAVAVNKADSTVQRFAYSTLHLQMTEAIDEIGVKTQYQYDTKGNLLKMVEAFELPEQRVTEYERNSLGQLTKVTRKGRTEVNGTVTPDAVVSMEYDAQGQVNHLVDAENFDWRVQYDRAGNMVSMTDPLNHTTRYILDAAGNLLSMTDALNHKRSYTYDKVGNRSGATDARSKTMAYRYDAMNRRKDTTNAVTGVYKMEYNAEGLLVNSTDEDGRRQDFEYDNFLEITKQADALSNTTQHSYRVPDGTSTGALGSLYSPTETVYPTYTQRNRYDQLERLTSTTLVKPDQTTQNTSMTYDPRGLMKNEVDGYGKTTSVAYNSLRQRSVISDRLNNKTKLDYDARGNLLQVTDANNHTHRYEYDRNNRATKEVRPLGQAIVSNYDAAGRLASQTDPNGNKGVFTYDDANRLTQIKQYSAANTLVRTVSYSLDDAGNLVAWSDTDHTRSQSSSAVLAYDEANRKTGETVTYPAGNTMSYGYGYSLAGKKTSLLWPDNTKIDYSYTNHGELETVTIPGEGTISVNQFQWLTPLKTTLPGGSTKETTYDGLFNLSSLKVKSPSQQTVLTLANTYGKVQELKQSQRNDVALNSSSASNYTYDDEIRLTKAAVDSGGGVDTETFTLDGVANRTNHSRVNGDWIYDENNRLKQRGSGQDATTYDYDDTGNLIKKTEPGNKVTQFIHDIQNRLSEVKDGSGNLIARYGYDLMDRRIWKEQYRGMNGTPLAQAKRMTYLYADEGLIAESQQNITLNSDQTVTVNGLPQITSQYGVRPNAAFTTGVLFIKTKNSNEQDVVAYYHYDNLNTPLEATDKAGNVVWSASYNAFGNATIMTPTATTINPTISSYLRLPGQVEDEETGLHYNWHRYYDRQTGRYLQSDPIGLKGGVNTYAYVGGNPISFADPTGKLVFVVWYGGLALATGGVAWWYATHPVELPKPLPNWLVDKIIEICTVKVSAKACLAAWEKEYEACDQYWNLGERAVKQCQGRANDRHTHCMKKNKPGDPPPVWTPDELPG